MNRSTMRYAAVGRLAAVLFALSVPTTLAAARLDPKTEIAPFAAEAAREHGLDAATVSAILARAAVLERVLKSMRRPAEAKPWKEYRPIFLVEKRIAEGVRYWQRNAASLDAASARFGVPPRIVVAIIGVETLYGERAGNIRVIDALATLGFRYPKRAKFFRRELFQYLLLAKEERLDVLALKGSYAGAMGIGQFIPSSYRAYAIDFDDDGRRDLLESHHDAIGSVANYLARHGWQRGAPVTVPASVSGQGIASLLAKGIKPHRPLSSLLEQGVTPRGEVTGSPAAALIELDGSAGTEHWLAFQNFYTITRYNHSKLYAMAVHQLSLAIEQRYAKSGQ